MMKEEMMKFLNEAQIPLYFEEKQIIKEFIETFFNSYQPERLNETDHDGDLTQMICESLNTADK